MKVAEARLVIDKEGNPSIVAKCEMGVFETKGKFQLGFAIGRDRKTEELFLIAFRDHPKNPIAVMRARAQAIEWLETAIKKNGYKWYHLYTSGVERVDGMYAFAVPFDAEGWNELPESVANDFKRMIVMLKKTEDCCPHCGSSEVDKYISGLKICRKCGRSWRKNEKSVEKSL